MSEKTTFVYGSPVVIVRGYRVRITGTYEGEPFVYEDPEGDGSFFLHPEGEGGLDTTRFHWTDGNYGCDCNRLRFLNATRETHPKLFYPEGTPSPDGEGEYPRCGTTIRIDTIETLNMPGKQIVLRLNESEQINEVREFRD